MDIDNDTIPVYDVIIIGAGLSGIGAAYHIQNKCPGKTYTVLEGREAIGGTWDLFRYPGIRSDSDMYTFGFAFNPWSDRKSIADGPTIMEYIYDTTRKFGIDKKIQFNHKVLHTAWTDEEQMWTIQIAPNEQVKHEVIKGRFVFACCGYYDYDKGYVPEFPGRDTFLGPIIHPQHWNANLDYKDKNVIVIGSGATAITLVPEMAKKAKKVIMLQRSPTYIMNLPSEDVIANFLKKILPKQVAHTISRWKNILLALAMYKVSRRWPDFVRRLIKKGIRKELGEDYDLKHFDPKYEPWDQRLCIVPDNDLFHKIKEGKVEMVTDEIDRFTPKGIMLKSGNELEANVIVTATGFSVKILGGITNTINGKTFDSGKAHSYRGVMFSDIPNFAIAVGYTNATWTLKCDLNCHFVTRILNYMDRKNLKVCTPRFDSELFATEPLLDFDAGYIKRAESILPKQGSKPPWKVYQNYLRDTISLKFGAVDDKYLEYE